MFKRRMPPKNKRRDNKPSCRQRTFNKIHKILQRKNKDE